MGDETRWKLLHGDSREVLPTLPENSVDAVVTDPPAGVSFMGKAWDGDKGGRDAWIAWLGEIMAEALRVLKPGGHAVVWALPRTSHWTGMALEDAGFEVRDCLLHLFGSGFPKSLDVGKAIDRQAGAEREVIGPNPSYRRLQDHPSAYNLQRNPDLTAPATDAAKAWDGFGTALKPSHEMWWLCRKPPSEPSIAANVLKWGCGGLNIGATRVGTQEPDFFRTDDGPTQEGGNVYGWANDPKRGKRGGGHTEGRFPPNCVLTHHPACVRRAWGQGSLIDAEAVTPNGHDPAKIRLQNSKAKHSFRYRDDGDEWECHPSCTIRELARQSGTLKSGTRQGCYTRTNGAGLDLGHKDAGADLEGSEGTAARFFPQFSYDDGDYFPFHYCAKAARSERDKGLDMFPRRRKAQLQGALHSQDDVSARFLSQPMANIHPTVKPLSLLCWLARLITPPGGTVLDPFLGSGTTAVACLKEGFRFIGIEREEEYLTIARGRLQQQLPFLFDETDETPDG